MYYCIFCKYKEDEINSRLFSCPQCIEKYNLLSYYVFLDLNNQYQSVQLDYNCPYGFFRYFKDNKNYYNSIVVYPYTNGGAYTIEIEKNIVLSPQNFIDKVNNILILQ